MNVPILGMNGALAILQVVVTVSHLHNGGDPVKSDQGGVR
jgi:hypothetical protein